MLSDKDRRRFKRYRLKSGFHLSIGGNSFQANTIDYSLGGIGLSIEDTPPITSGSAINLHVEDLNLNIDGKIVWSEQVNSRLRVGIERASISGFLKHYLLPDIFLDLHRSEKDGTLDIRNGSIIKRIYIKNGDMVFATSNKEEDRLGEVMLKAGRLTIDQYYQSVDIMKKTGKRQGAALVELGYLKPEDVIWIVRHQVEEIILSLFQWEDGNFIFKEGPLPSDEVIILKLSAANHIYRGIKRINSLTHIKNAMPTKDTILYYSTDPMNLFQDINLDNKDKDILSLIDGKRNIHEILSISPLDNFQTMKTLYALLSTRIIELKEKGLTEDKTYEEIMKEPEIKVDSAFIEKVEDLYKRIEITDYYGIFGIEKWATMDKIKKAYYKVAKEFHPDKHFYLPSETLKNKLNMIFSQITDAYKILSDPKMRREYDQNLSIRPAKIASNNMETARARFKEGKDAFKKGAYTEAAELFGQAAYLDSSVPAYHFYHGLSLTKNKKLGEAEKAICKELMI
ncbi:MAG: DnaJ domain-containing protein [Nitrospirota bacterium]|nr:DnaJ domain-containing protein [Nitrospirota bacterium]